MHVKLDIGLDGIVNVVVTVVLVGVTWFYARRASQEAGRANRIAADAERVREREAEQRERQESQLAEARIGVLSYGLQRQLRSWIREATPGLLQLDKLYEYLLGSGSDVKHDMGVAALKKIGSQTAVAQAGQWLTEHTGEHLNRAEARVYELAVDAPRAREAVRAAIYDVTVLFYEATRRMTEQEVLVRRGGDQDPVEVVLAFRQVRQCEALLPGVITEELRAAAERLSR